MDKIQVTETMGNIAGYDLEGTIQSAIDTLRSYGNQYGFDARLDWGQHWSYGDETYSYDVRVTRLETDEEYEKRMQALDTHKTMRIAQLEAELKKLKGE